MDLNRKRLLPDNHMHIKKLIEQQVFQLLVVIKKDACWQAAT
jgi:hypothetical protein